MPQLAGAPGLRPLRACGLPQSRARLRLRAAGEDRLCWATVSQEHERWMRLAIEEAELARGTTGDNPWVGCVIVSPSGDLLGRGHTLGPGEDHAEIAAARDAQAGGHS